jgi:hypothetical protein
MIKLLCPICGENTAVHGVPVDLFEHVITKHTRRSGSPWGGYLCWCGKNFGYWSDLRNHLRDAGGPAAHYLEYQLKAACDG